jgi:hypothetical protein
MKEIKLKIPEIKLSQLICFIVGMLIGIAFAVCFSHSNVPLPVVTGDERELLVESLEDYHNKRQANIDKADATEAFLLNAGSLFNSVKK